MQVSKLTNLLRWSKILLCVHLPLALSLYFRKELWVQVELV
jgi:hypothetical protein